MKPKRTHIAIADDHSLFCAGLRLIIETRPDFEIVLVAHNGQELLDGIKRLKTPPDVIFLDLHMPEKNGFTTITELRTLFNDMDLDNKCGPRIVILSMHDQEDYILHMLDLGANSYLLKNSSAPEVHATIENVVQKGFHFTDHVTKVMLNGLKRKRTPPPAINASNKFSSRELEVCDLMKEGLTTQEIADRLFISNRTVETHRKNLMEKFGVKNSAGVIYRALKEGLVK